MIMRSYYCWLMMLLMLKNSRKLNLRSMNIKRQLFVN